MTRANPSFRAPRSPDDPVFSVRKDGVCQLVVPGFYESKTSSVNLIKCIFSRLVSKYEKKCLTWPFFDCYFLPVSFLFFFVCFAFDLCEASKGKEK